MRLLIIGCGYVGKPVALQALGRGWQVTALTRSDKRARELAELGIEPVMGDVLASATLAHLPESDLCLYAVGYDRSSTHDKKSVYVDGLKNVLQVIQSKVPRLIYVSSTSVYGEDSGNWVNEQTDPQPANESGKICLAAEELVRQFYLNENQSLSANILRLSGIYGPGRLIGRKAQLQAGQPISGNPQGWLNLVHLDDILQALFAIAETAEAKPLYLLSDERPNRRIDFYTALAEFLETPPPVMPNEPTKQLGKRCDSSFIRDDLNLKLVRPTINEGIPASI